MEFKLNVYFNIYALFLNLISTISLFLLSNTDSCKNTVLKPFKGYRQTPFVREKC